MKQYTKPVLESVKLLVKEDIALTRTNVSGAYNEDGSTKVTTYKSRETAITSVDTEASANA